MRRRPNWTSPRVYFIKFYTSEILSKAQANEIIKDKLIYAHSWILNHKFLSPGA